jgi:hypothetical protein
MTNEALVLFAIIVSFQTVIGFLAFLWLMRASHANTVAVKLLTKDLALRTNRIIQAASKMERLTRLGYIGKK